MTEISPHLYRRWLVAILCVAFVLPLLTLPLLLSLLALLASNAIAFVVLLFNRKTSIAIHALMTGALLSGALTFTNWGFSMPNPKVTVSWAFLMPAIIAQLALIASPLWLPCTGHNRG